MQPERVWTTEPDDNGNNTNLSRISTASATEKPAKPINHTYIAVQSRFRRRFSHKAIFITLLVIIISLIIGLIVMRIYYYKYYTITCQTKECVRSAANLLQSMDKTVDPCTDFYKFTCGNWADDHPRPDNANSFDWFSEKQTKIIRKMRQYLQANTTETDPMSVDQARTMYKACMNTDAMDALGLQPVLDYLKEFALPSQPTILNLTQINYGNFSFDWITTVAKIKKTLGSDLLIGFDIFPDLKNNTEKRLAFGSPEAGSMLPFNTDFEKRLYRMKRKRITKSDDDDDDSEEIAAYMEYMIEVVSTVVFVANPSLNLEKILPNIQEAAAVNLKFTKAFQKIIEIAEDEDDEDKETVSNEFDVLSYTVDDFQNVTDRLIAPKSLPIWRRYLSVLFADVPAVRLNLTNDLILTSAEDVEYLENLVQFMTNATAAEIEFYVWWVVVEDLVLHTTTAIRKLHYEYSRKFITLETGIPRSIYCTGGTDKLMGMAVSYAFADQQFSDHIRPKVVQMVNNIRESFNNLVRSITWMDDSTKCVTLEKSLAMRSLIGYPEWLRNGSVLDEYYAGVSHNESLHLSNMINMLRRQMRTKLQTFRETEEFGWGETTPADVNAFHVYQANAIRRMFDKGGNLRQWWTNETIAEYVNRTNCFVKQYGSYYVPEVKEYVNGEQTLGENIADNGGLREAYHAYRLYVRQTGKEHRLPGFEDYTHDQLFFMSYGNMWCETQTLTSIKWALEDSHCPGKIRMNGALTNSEEFNEAFKCGRDQKMNPTSKCRIW